MLRFWQTYTLKRLFFPLFIAFGLFGTLMWALGDLTQSVDASTSFFSRSFFKGQREEAASACTIAVFDVLTYTTLQQAVDDVQENGTVTVMGGCVYTGTTQMAYITKSLTLLGGGNGATLDAKQAGRVLYITGTVEVTVQNLELRGGEALGNGDGGGIYVMGADVTLKNTVLTSNTASYGGGLYVATGTLTLDNATVDHNRAASGGGVYLNNSVATFKGGSSLAQNEAISGDGGGMLALHSMVTVMNSRIVTNTAQNDGGGIYADNYNSNTITLMGGSEVVGNEATLGTGGGLHATQGTITLDGIIVSNHVITEHGAALYLDVTEATLKDNVFIENKSLEGSAGALYLKATKAEFSGNLINNNHAASDGGAFWLEVDEMTLNNNTFIANQSLDGRGGALHLEVTGSPQANISGNIIKNNEAKIDGGGLFLRNINDILLSNNELNENKALTGNGGGLYLYNSNATLNNNQMMGNEAHNNGGGLYAHSNSDVTLENDNELLNNIATSGSGGALYLNSGDATINDNRIQGNKAKLHGGGYYANNDTNMLDGNSFSGNEAETGHGGGLYVSGNAAILSQNRIEQNKSPAGRGGGMYIVEVAAQIFESHLIGNEAVYGGGLFLSLDNSIVSNNIMTGNNSSYGGAFYLSNSSAELRANEIMSNTASDGGGIFLSESNNAIVKENVIAYNIGNSAGGGLYLELSNATIEQNQITTNTVVAPTEDYRYFSALRNRAEVATGGAGGALFLTESDATLTRNIIRANKGYNGGAFYLNRSTPTVINNMIVQNQATNRASALYNIASSPSFLHNTIANNHGGDGRALFVTHEESSYSTLRMSNTILFDHSVALYVEEGNSAMLNGTLWYDNQTNSAGSGSINTTGDIVGNPDFTTSNAGDYRLGANSAAIDSGVDAAIYEDIDLKLRPTYLNKYDIGADEYHTYGVSLNYQATPDPVMAGEELIYTIEVSNTGNVMQMATITANLPDDVQPSGIRVWTTPITPSYPWIKQIPVTVNLDYAGNLTSMAEVTSNLGNSASKTVTSQVIAPGRHLEASFEAITDTILAGEILTYNIKVTNTGNVPLEPTITATFDISSYPEPLTWTTSLMVQPNNGYLFEQQIPVTMTFDPELTEPYTLTSILEVTGTGQLKKVIETVRIEPREPSLEASFEAITDTILAGEILTYNIKVTNTGNVPLEPTITATFDISSYPEPLTWTTSLMVQPNNGYLFEQQIPVTMIFDFDLPNTMTSTLEVTAEGVVPQIISEPVTVTRRDPNLTLAASTNVSSRLTQEGQPIEYHFTLTNTGNTILYSPTVAMSTSSAPGALSTDTLIITRTLPLSPKEFWSDSRIVTVATDMYEILRPTASATAQDTNHFYPGEVMTTPVEQIESFEANVITVSQSVTSTSTISDERITYTLYITNMSKVVPITATIKNILPEQVTLLPGSQDNPNSIPILTLTANTVVITGALLTTCLPEELTNTVKVTTEQNVSHEKSEKIDFLGVVATITATKNGAWDDPLIWNDSGITNNHRVPQSSDRVYIPKWLVVTAPDAIEVKSLRNEGTLQRQAGGLLEINATNMICNQGWIIASDLITPTHSSSDIQLKAPRIENQGQIVAGSGITESNHGGSLLLESDHILNRGYLEAGNGGSNAEGLGGEGGSITIMSQNGFITTTKGSIIQAGNGGTGKKGGGDGGTISLIAQQMTLEGKIHSGDGGNILLYRPSTKGGDGGDIKLFANHKRCQGSIFKATMTSGNGGDVAPSTFTQRSGNSGGIVIMSAPTLALQDSKITVGQAGSIKNTFSAYPGNRAALVISSGDGDGSCVSEISAATSAPQLYAQDITLFGGDKFKLDLSNLGQTPAKEAIESQLALSATGKIDLATGMNGTIDLRGNIQQIIKSNLDTTMAVHHTKLLLGSGLELSDVAGENARRVEPKLLRAVSLVAPEAVRGKATVPMTIPFALVNRSAKEVQFQLSAESARLTKITISETLPITVLGGEIRELTAIITPSMILLDEITITASSQENEPETATLKVRLIIDEHSFSRIYLPLIRR